MEIILKYFTGLNRQQVQNFQKLSVLYTEWNSKINIISRKDFEHLYERHILHSLAIAKLISFAANSLILDAGTGGGFPGIPLAILFPEARFHLVDSVGKKIRVVGQIVQSLELQNTTWEQNRVESLSGPYDFVVSRAVAPLPKFIEWVKGLIGPDNCNSLANGILYLKGGDLNNELAGISYKTKVYPVSEYFNEPYFETKKIVHIRIS